MIINQEKIQRMIGGGASGNGSGSGIGGSDLVGYATQAWVNENYLSIEFFSSLFKAYDSSASPNEIAPNDGDTTAITNIKAMFGFWTEQYLSALGINSAGGGGGATSLVDLLDVNITSPTNGQALVYNATSGKWENQTIGGGSTGTLSSIGLVMPTGFSVSPGTLTEDGSFTVSFAAGYGLPLTADVNKGVTAYGWGNHANAGYLTSVDFSDLTSHPTTIAGYGITDAKIEYGSIKLGTNSITPWTTNNHPSTIAGYGINNAYIGNGSIVLGTNTITPWTNSNHPSTLAGYCITDAMLIKSLTTTDSIDTLYDAGSYRFAATAQGVWPTGVTANYGQMLVVHGGGDTVAQIFFPYNSSAAYLRNGNPVNSGSWNGWKQLVTPDMNVESATKLETSRTLWGQSFNGTANVSGNMNSVGSITMSGYLYMNNDTSIQMKDSNGTQTILLTLNTGNTFALGYGPRIAGYQTDIQGENINFAVGQSSRINAMNISNAGMVHIQQGTQGLRIGDGLITWDSQNNAFKIERISGNSVVAGNLYATGGVSALGVWAGANGDLTVTGVTATGNVQGANLIATTKVTSPMFYLDSSRYIYLDGTTLKYYNGSQSKTIVLS